MNAIAKELPQELVTKVSGVSEAAKIAYETKRYLDARNLVLNNKQDILTVDGNTAVQAFRKWAYAAYYLGNEGNPQWKKGIIDNPVFYEESVAVALEAIEKFTTLIDIEARIAILNVLALATRWIKNKDGNFKRKEAYQWSDQAILEAKISSNLGLVSVALNTRNILLSEDKRFKEAEAGCIEVATNSLLVGDYLTAGHGKQNEGDTYRREIEEIKDNQEKAALHLKAYLAYREAQALYTFYENQSGNKATAHLESAGRKAEEEKAFALKAKINHN